MSEDDKNYIAQQIGDSDKIEVVSNGVDTAWFDEKPSNLPDEPTVLSVGTFKWLPNVEAVDFLVQQVWPLLKEKVNSARLWIVGNAPTPNVLAYEQNDQQIKVTGNIPDIRDAFKQAHVLAAPVFSGKGTRYKVLEAMASGTPVVATPTAIEGLGVEDGQHVLLASDAQEMSDQISKLFNQPDLREKLAKKAKQYVTDHYDWRYISHQLDQVYQQFAWK